MIEKGIDTVVLGCTHYPFVIPLIQQIVGEKVRVIDPAPAVARRVRHLLETGGRMKSSGVCGEVQFFTTGDPFVMQSMLPTLFGEGGVVQSAQWKNDLKIEKQAG